MVFLLISPPVLSKPLAEFFGLFTKLLFRCASALDTDCLQPLVSGLSIFLFETRGISLLAEPLVFVNDWRMTFVGIL
jgi:hypothetical protein